MFNILSCIETYISTRVSQPSTYATNFLQFLCILICLRFKGFMQIKTQRNCRIFVVYVEGCDTHIEIYETLNLRQIKMQRKEKEIILVYQARSWDDATEEMQVVGLAACGFSSLEMTHIGPFQNHLPSPLRWCAIRTFHPHFRLLISYSPSVVEFLISPMNQPLLVVIWHLAIKIRRKAPPAKKFQHIWTARYPEEFFMHKGCGFLVGGGGGGF